MIPSLLRDVFPIVQLSHVETKIYSIFCLRQNAQRAALRAAGQATSGNCTVSPHP